MHYSRVSLLTTGGPRIVPCINGAMRGMYSIKMVLCEDPLYRAWLRATIYVLYHIASPCTIHSQPKYWTTIFFHCEMLFKTSWNDVLHKKGHKNVRIIAFWGEKIYERLECIKINGDRSPSKCFFSKRLGQVIGIWCTNTCT